MSLKYNNTAMIFVCDTLNKCMCLTLALDRLKLHKKQMHTTYRQKQQSLQIKVLDTNTEVLANSTVGFLSLPFAC